LREARLSGRRHSLRRDRAAIGFHYDQPIEFYRTFLDENLVYSCGWGALVVRAAREFGARVTGITLSERQAEEGRRRIAQEGLGDRVRIELRDYREIKDEPFDKIVSIGMFEHVGRANLPEYFRTAYSLLKNGGLFLNHGISTQENGDGRARGFMDRFIFPDGELVRVSDALQIAEHTGFEVRDVENLREHYHRTLRHWVSRLEEHRDDAIAAAGEQSYRAWRLYMAGSAQGFRTGRMGLYQSLLAKPRGDGTAAVPPTRRDLYN
jgi:cyclopropane-fatty-acyl-phospholipid synthase